MKKIEKIWIVPAFALMLTAHMPAAWADGCRSEEEESALAQMKKAEDSERAGRLKEAYKMQVQSGCLDGDGYKRHAAMHKRIGLQLGQQDEKQGKLAAAFDWYQNTGNGADADRVKMKQVNASPRDRNVVSDAIGYFRFQNNDARVTELRQLAAKNADLELANEEKAFAASKVSFDQLNNAQDWLSLVGEGDKKVRVRAEQRGDTLLKEDTFRHLENARQYFDTANAKQKEKALKDKALRLAQEHEKKGEITQAKNFYNLADAGDKGDALEARTDAENKKSEATRQKKFTKEQGDLEKELGL